jgi:hypothetical protein
MSRIVRWLAAGLAAVVLTPTIGTAAQAATAGPDAPRSSVATASTDRMTRFLESVRQVTETPRVTGADGARFVAQARSAIVRTGTHLAGGDALSYRTAKVLRFHGGITVVTVPITTTALTGSGVAVQFDKVGSPVAVTEVQLHLRTAGNVVRAQVWNDGTLVLDSTASTAAPAPTGVHTDAFFDWGKLGNCLASAGYGWATVAILSAACAWACVTLVLCIPCLVALTAATSGTIGYCVAYASG